jgi:transcriptional regulator with PAS, ATPase and Fis domain
VAENCAALSDSLLEAELFGYRAGAFTGAQRDKKGLFELASGGTLFLDEVGDMSLNMQKKLLRALEEGSIRPLGAKEKISISVRILCATNQHMRGLVEEGRFREDLYYRLNVVTVVVPALRERREDIPLLVDYFLDSVARRTGSPRKTLAREALAVFLEYEWPGNVRELENVVKNLCLMTEQVEIDAHLLGSLLRPEGQGGGGKAAPLAEGVDPERVDYAGLQELLAELERDYLRRTLEKSAGNKSRAAQALGLTRPALYRSLKRLGLEA